MTYDVTFHPIKEEDIKYFVTEPIRLKDIAAAKRAIAVRLNQLSETSKGRQHLQSTFYPELFKFYDEAVEKKYIGQVGFWTAVMAGYLYPYWFGISTTLKWLSEKIPELKEYVSSIANISPDILGVIGDKNPSILRENWSAGGYIPAKKIHSFRKILTDAVKRGILETHDFEAYAGLFFALEFAEANETGLLEASEVLNRWEGFYTEPSNLRTDIVKKDFPYVLLSWPADTKRLQDVTDEYLKKGPTEYLKYLKDRFIS